MTIIVNPSNQQWGIIEPYLSLAEFLASPNASMLDYSTFVEGGDADDQNDALEQLIVRASSKADNYCYGRLGTLNAMVNTENGLITPDRWGEFIVKPEYSPILAVTAFQWGATPGQGNVVALSNNNCFVERDEFRVTQTGAGGSIAYAGIGALSAVLNGRSNGRWAPQYCQWSYINGWPNSFTTEDMDADSTSFTPVSNVGFLPGNQVTFWDGSNDETVVIASNYVAGTSPVTLQNPTQFSHVSGTNVSALPASVKQAVIHFVIAMVSQRGQTGFVVSPAGEMTPAEMKGGSNDMHEMRGYDLLDPFVRIWGRT